MEYIISDYAILGIWGLFTIVLVWWVKRQPTKEFKKTYDVWVGETLHRCEVTFKKTLFKRSVSYNKKLTTQELRLETELFLHKGKLPEKARPLGRVYESSSHVLR